VETNRTLDAPLGIVAMQPEGPWHVVAIHEEKALPAGEVWHGNGIAWTFWADTLCINTGMDREWVFWPYFRFPADLPPGARLCKRCEMLLRKGKRKNED